MAMVHPSRVGLVPQGSTTRRRSPSPQPSRRSPSPRRTSKAEDRHSRTYRNTHGDREDVKGRDRKPSRPFDREDDYDRGRSHRRSRDRDGGQNRRASPKYEDYRRQSPPRDGSAHRRQADSMYPNRKDRGLDRDTPPHNGYPSSRNSGGTDFFESRRLRRETMTVNIWPPSPKAPARDLSPKRSTKKSKRRLSVSSDTDSEEEERRRKDRRKRKERRKEEKQEKKRRRSRSRQRSDEEEKYQSGKKSYNKSKSPDRRASSSRRTRSPLPNDDDDEWIIKDSGSGAVPPLAPVLERALQTSIARDVGSDDDDDIVGPQPAAKANVKRIDERSYGGALLRGEGSAMAAFLQDGTESRIPRRGEIGLTSDEIAQYEDVGYVMSGSRHRRMNAVRIRKENQVISAEEKRGILKLQKEERERRESILREEFSELVQESLKGSERPKAG